MATVVFEVYNKYWRKAATDDMVNAIIDKLAERGITATIETALDVRPQRTTITLTGVPANLRLTHEEIAEKVIQRLGSL